jgi:hypothetical protein
LQRELAYNEIGNITETAQNTTTWTYTYPSSGPSSMRPHAVSSVNGWSYQYDANGNMVTRTLGSDRYVLKYDIEGCVVEVKKNNNEIAMLMYDGDGNQVKVTRGSGVTSTTVYVGNGGQRVEVPLGDGVTAVHIGNYCEKDGNTTRTYYYDNGQRVAVCENGTLYWLLRDHPSASLRAGTGRHGSSWASASREAIRWRFGTGLDTATETT